ncbi:GldG family protein [Thermodesulfobacteriota bacterium]
MGIKNRSGDYFRFITYLVVIVLVNIAGITLFFRLDLTSNKIYSISKASQAVVSTLSEPLTINVFFTKNLPAPHNNTERYLHDLMEEYSAYGNRYFNYRFYDVSPEEGDISEEARANQELARSYGIHPLQIQAVEDDEIKFQKAYMGLALIHGDIVDRIPAITSTDRLEYRLTTAIQKLNNKISALLRLPEKIRITLFLSSSLETIAPYMRLQGLSEIPAKIDNIIKTLNSKSYGKLVFIHLDPTKEKVPEDVLKKYKIMSLKWPEIPEKKIQSGEGSIGLIMEYGDKVVDLPLMKVMRLPIIGTHYELADLNKLEDVISDNLESLIDINEDLGYLADHGTPSLWGGPGGIPGMQSQSSLTSFNTLASQTYTMRGVRLSDEAIPESLNCLVIAGPKEPFSDYELFQIDQFLMRGKNLALFIDAFSEGGATPGSPMPQGGMYQPLDTGLEKLLEHYGISITRSYVMDESCFKQRLPQSYGGGEKAIYFVPFIMERFINRDLLFMKNIKGLLVSKVSPLEIVPERIKALGLKASGLFSSSEKSWEMKEWIDLNPMNLRPPFEDTEYRSIPLAYILEGEFPSYFAGKPIPEKEVKKEASTEESGKEKPADEKAPVDLSNIESEGGFIPKGKPGKVFLVASSELLKDNIIDSEGRSPNALFILNLIDYLNNREEMAVMRSKENTFNPLKKLSGNAKAFVKYFNIIGLPVLVVFFGLFVWFRRHQRKKEIQIMFGE